MEAKTGYRGAAHGFNRRKSAADALERHGTISLYVRRAVRRPEETSGASRHAKVIRADGLVHFHRVLGDGLTDVAIIVHDQ